MRVQQDRGQAPYPVGLELTLLVVASLGCLLVLGVHAGRAAAAIRSKAADAVTARRTWPDLVRMQTSVACKRLWETGPGR